MPMMNGLTGSQLELSKRQGQIADRSTHALVHGCREIRCTKKSHNSDTRELQMLCLSELLWPFLFSTMLSGLKVRLCRPER